MWTEEGLNLHRTKMRGKWGISMMNWTLGQDGWCEWKVESKWRDGMWMKMGTVGLCPACCED